MDMSEGLRVFADKYNRSIADPNLRRLYELDQSARRDERAVARTVQRDTYTSIIQNMLNNGVPLTTIYKYVGAPRSEIDAIIAKLRASSRV